MFNPGDYIRVLGLECTIIDIIIEDIGIFYIAKPEHDNFNDEVKLMKSVVDLHGRLICRGRNKKKSNHPLTNIFK